MARTHIFYHYDLYLYDYMYVCIYISNVDQNLHLPNYFFNTGY